MRRRVLSGVALFVCVVAAFLLSPSFQKRRVSREPTAAERQWFQDRIPGRWVVRFASGATTVLKLKVTEVSKPYRSFCGLEEDEEYTQVRWLTSAYACGGQGRLAYFAAVEGTMTSDEESLTGALRGSFHVYPTTSPGEDIHLSFIAAGDLNLLGTLEEDGTVMRGPAPTGPRATLGAFEARRASAIPKPVIQEPR